MAFSFIRWLELIFGSMAIAVVVAVFWVAIKNNPRAIEEQLEARRKRKIHQLLDQLSSESQEYWQVLQCLAPDNRYDPKWANGQLTFVLRCKDWHPEQTLPPSQDKQNLDNSSQSNPSTRP